MPKLLKTISKIDLDWLQYSPHSMSKASVLILCKTIVIDYMTEVMGIEVDNLLQIDYDNDEILIDNGYTFVGAIGCQEDDMNNYYRVFVFFKYNTTLYCFYHLLQDGRITMTYIYDAWEKDSSISEVYLKLTEFQNRVSI